MAELLSIIIPIYRVEKYLDKCILSVARQTYSDLEIILVDDGSDDGSAEICDRWKEKDSRVVVIHKENEGLVKARKVGLQAATGKYIGYVDADDWIDGTMYEVLMDLMMQHKCDMVCSGRVEEFPDRRYICPNKIQEGYYEGKELEEKVVNRVLSDTNGSMFLLYPTVWDKVYRREFLLKYQMAVPDVVVTGEDVACVVPAVAGASSVYISGKCMYHYNRRRVDSMLGASDPLYFMRLSVLLTYLREAVKNSPYRNELERQIKDYEMNQIRDGIRKEFHIEISYADKDRGNNNIYLFPYELIEKKEDIIIYGAGRIGKQFMHQMQYNTYCNVVKWIDSAPNDPNVSSVETLAHVHYDHIVIAVSNINAVEEIKNTLRKFNVDEEKIVWKRYRMD